MVLSSKIGDIRATQCWSSPTLYGMYMERTINRNYITEWSSLTEVRKFFFLTGTVPVCQMNFKFYKCSIMPNGSERFQSECVLPPGECD